MKYLLSFFILFSLFTAKSQVSINWSEPIEIQSLQLVEQFIGNLDNHFCWVRRKYNKYHIDFINPKENKLSSLSIELKTDYGKLFYLGGIVFNGETLLFSAINGKKKRKTKYSLQK
ncbi:MAG: hypothetical protein ACI9N1_002154 [Flavobacteriales bacterium]|jgi:hypothetical protein